MSPYDFAPYVFQEPALPQRFPVILIPVLSMKIRYLHQMQLESENRPMEHLLRPVSFSGSLVDVYPLVTTNILGWNPQG